MIEISIDGYELAMEDLCLGSVNFVDLIILVGLIIVATRWQEMEFSNALKLINIYRFTMEIQTHYCRSVEGARSRITCQH